MLPQIVKNTIKALLGSAGKSDPALRRAVFERTRTGADEIPAGPPSSSALREFVQKVDERPWTVSDDDFRKLHEAGYSEDQIFELTVAASAGAGVRRFEAGLRALEAAAPEDEGLQIHVGSSMSLRVVDAEEKRPGGR